MIEIYIVASGSTRKEFSTLTEADDFRKALGIQQPIYQADSFGNVTPMSEMQVQQLLSKEKQQPVQPQPQPVQQQASPQQSQAQPAQFKTAIPDQKPESQTSKILRWILIIGFFLVILFFLIFIIYPMLKGVYNTMMSI